MIINQKNGKVNFKMILVITLIIMGIVFYWYQTRNSLSDTYKIKTASSVQGHDEMYINLTGKNIKEKKIKLSNDYWTSGKFHF